MIPEHIKNLLDNAKNMISIMDVSLQAFGEVLDETIKNAPEADKIEIDRFKKLHIEVMNKAKKGDTKGFEELINSYKNGRKSS